MVEPHNQPMKRVRLGGLGLNKFASWEVGKDYECLKILGSGSYGEVAAAIHKPTGTKVAIKRMNGIFEDEIDCKRILREIYLLAKLDNHAVVSLFDIVEPTDPVNFQTVYLVLNLSESDLKKVIKSAIYLE